MAERDDGLRGVDRGTEVSLKLNNILTALILMVMSWIGVSIEGLKREVSQQNTDITVSQTQIAYNADATRVHRGQISDIQSDMRGLTQRVQRLEK